MSDVIDSETGSSLRFPDPAEEAYARAQEFRRLSPEERWRQIAELRAIGMTMVHHSPRRAEIERRLEAQEAEWQEFQRRLFRAANGWIARPFGVREHAPALAIVGDLPPGPAKSRVEPVASGRVGGAGASSRAQSESKLSHSTSARAIQIARARRNREPL
jgi:hypothetical protein